MTVRFPPANKVWDLDLGRPDQASWTDRKSSNLPLIKVAPLPAAIWMPGQVRIAYVHIAYSIWEEKILANSIEAIPTSLPQKTAQNLSKRQRTTRNVQQTRVCTHNYQELVWLLKATNSDSSTETTEPISFRQPTIMRPTVPEDLQAQVKTRICTLQGKLTPLLLVWSQ